MLQIIYFQNNKEVTWTIIRKTYNGKDADLFLGNWTLCSITKVYESSPMQSWVVVMQSVYCTCVRKIIV